MKYLKSYENINNPKIGDYVIAIDNITSSKDANDILKNTIGKIISTNKWYRKNPLYTTKYDNIPEDLKGHFSYDNEQNIRKLTRIEIKHFSNSKKELETIISANKYNI